MEERGSGGEDNRATAGVNMPKAFMQWEKGEGCYRPEVGDRKARFAKNDYIMEIK